MKTTTTDSIDRALQTLTSAGISFSVAERCPAPDCPVCSARPVSAAA